MKGILFKIPIETEFIDPTSGSICLLSVLTKHMTEHIVSLECTGVTTVTSLITYYLYYT